MGLDMDLTIKMQGKSVVLCEWRKFYELDALIRKMSDTPDDDCVVVANLTRDDVVSVLHEILEDRLCWNGYTFRFESKIHDAYNGFRVALSLMDAFPNAEVVYASSC